MTDTPQNDEKAAGDMLAAYSAALDEIWMLRRALAYEARVVEAHTLDIIRLGQNRRDHLVRAIDRMRASARGSVMPTYAHVNARVMGRCMEEAGAKDGLTRNAWEAALPARNAELGG